MLKRSDLSKQFELVVQQEIKNFQDASYQMNQTLNELNSKIENIEKTTSSNNALLESKHKSLSIQVEILLSQYNQNQKRLDSHITDTSSITHKIGENLHSVATYTIDAHKKNDHAMSLLTLLRDSITSLQEQIKERSINLQSNLDQFDRSLSSKFANFKQQIIDLPSDSEDIRKEFREKLASHKVDVEGITKEFKVNRKEFMVIEKKLESIYTLIDGLKKTEAIS